MQRAYTYDEIEQMRSDLRVISTPIGRAYNEDRIRQDAEDRLRTHLLAGTEPADIRNAAEEKRRQQDAYWKSLTSPC